MLSLFIPRLNIKSFSVFSADVLCVLSMTSWLRALLAGIVDGIQQREFPPLGAWTGSHLNKSPFWSPLGGLGTLHPFLPQMPFLLIN